MGHADVLLLLEYVLSPEDGLSVRPVRQFTGAGGHVAVLHGEDVVRVLGHGSS